MVRYVFGDGSILPMLVTNVHEDGAIGDQVFLSPAAHEGQREAWTKAYGFLAPHPTGVLMDRIPYSEVKEGQTPIKNTWHWPEDHNGTVG